ncbi:unnamed protein product [Rhodiola kirilowii]
MAKGGKLTKLKSAMKKWNSFSKHGGTTSSVYASACSDDDTEIKNATAGPEDHLYPVYVGKTRRQYLLTSQVVSNPLFGELVERSSGESEEMIIRCEVVLFEHLLWMIENGADPQPESLAQFYAY